MISILIVNYNSCAWIKECLNSIYNYAKEVPFEILVIDNGSTDGSCEMLEKEFKSVYLIKNKKNMGFARANNQAFLACKGDIILLLNPDTRWADNSIKVMADYLVSHEDIGAVAPQYFYPNGEMQIYYNRFPSFSAILKTIIIPQALRYRSKTIRDYWMMEDNFDEVMEIEQPAASCLMLKREVLNGEELMDERFPVFYNDVDLCRRIWNKGFKIIFLPKARIIHGRSEAGLKSEKLSDKLIYLQAMGQVHYFLKYGHTFFPVIIYILQIMKKSLKLISNMGNKPERSKDFRVLVWLFRQRDVKSLLAE